MRLTIEDVRLPLAHFTLWLALELEANSIGVFGASGAGKTSFLELLAGVRRAASGTICLDDVTLQSCSAFVPPHRRAIGYVPQDLALFPHLNVRKNIFYGARRPPAEASGAISAEHVIQVLQLGKLMERRIGDLSGGEKQRVALARAIMSQPRLILLDEPFTALDPHLRQTGLDLVERLRTEFSIPFLCVSHSRTELMALCEVLIEISQGNVVQIERVRL